MVSMRNTPGLPMLALAATLAVAGCDEGSTGLGGDEVTLSFAAPSVSGPSASMAPSASIGTAAHGESGAAATDPGGNALEIDTVQLVLAEIELERVEELEDCDSSGTGNPCQEFAAGPVLIDLPLDGNPITPIGESIPEGSYDELELEIEVPDEDDQGTIDFVAANPSFSDASVRVKGTYNGEPFDVFLDGEAELELELVPAFEAGPDAPISNITVEIDPNVWFVGTDGNFIDPRTLAADDVARDRVEENIENSFEAFGDDDRDGEDDDG